MSSSTFSTNRVIHFRAGPRADQSLPEPLAPRPPQFSLKGRSAGRSFGRQSKIRPEIVARARALAADPDYPPLAVVRRIAQEILTSANTAAYES
jgi:hypothetical protein